MNSLLFLIELKIHLIFYLIESIPLIVLLFLILTNNYRPQFFTLKT